VRHAATLKAGTAPEPEVLGMPFATSPYPMMIVDRENHFILDINNVAVQRYGYSRQEFLAMTILDIRPTTDVPKLLHRLRLDPLRQASITAEKSRHQDKNGTVFPVVITVWKTTFRGRQAELVLARPEVDKVGVN
jgi:PAS domain S-box-containing protein